jgi:hypothetical protein
VVAPAPPLPALVDPPFIADAGGAPSSLPHAAPSTTSTPMMQMNLDFIRTLEHNGQRTTDSRRPRNSVIAKPNSSASFPRGVSNEVFDFCLVCENETRSDRKHAIDSIAHKSVSALTCAPIGYDCARLRQ